MLGCPYTTDARVMGQHSFYQVDPVSTPRVPEGPWPAIPSTHTTHRVIYGWGVILSPYGPSVPCNHLPLVESRDKRLPRWREVVDGQQEGDGTKTLKSHIVTGRTTLCLPVRGEGVKDWDIETLPRTLKRKDYSKVHYVDDDQLPGVKFLASVPGPRLPDPTILKSTTPKNTF